MLKYNRAQFWLFFLLFIFVMFDIFMTSVGIYDRHVASEASPRSIRNAVHGYVLI